MFDFINIQPIDIIDICLVGLIIYYIYKLIRGTAAISIFVGILMIYVFWIVVKALKMSLLSALMGQVLGVGFIALIILFQQEIRRFLLHLGQRYVNGKKITFDQMKRYTVKNRTVDAAVERVIKRESR